MRYLKYIMPYTDQNKSIRLVVTSCQHYGSKQFSRRRFKSFLKENLSVPQSYLILFGDFFDAIVSSDRKRYDALSIDTRYNKSERTLNSVLKDGIEDLQPYKNQIIGILTGNHEWQLEKRCDISLTQLLCEALGCENLGMSFLMKVFLRRNGNSDRVRSFTMYGHHGFGGGLTTGGSITKYERKLKEFDADIYCFGHDHKSYHIKLPRVGINNSGQPYDKPITLICCGTFKKSLSNDTSITWEETKGFGPHILGGKVLEITALNEGGVKIECLV